MKKTRKKIMNGNYGFEGEDLEWYNKQRNKIRKLEKQNGKNIAGIIKFPKNQKEE